MSTHDQDDDDYEVGYGKPPKHTRFQKGQSGNPNGRPKGAKGFSASLKRELESQITVRERDRTIRISKAEAAAKRLVANALNGDMKALSMLMAVDADFAREIEAKAATEAASRDLEPEGREILCHFAECILAGEWNPDEGEGEP